MAFRLLFYVVAWLISTVLIIKDIDKGSAEPSKLCVGLELELIGFNKSVDGSEMVWGF